MREQKPVSAQPVEVSKVKPTSKAELPIIAGGSEPQLLEPQSHITTLTQKLTFKDMLHYESQRNRRLIRLRGK